MTFPLTGPLTRPMTADVALPDGSAHSAVPALGMNFAASEYTERGETIASPLDFVRASSASRTANDGVTVTTFSDNVPCIDDRGLYLAQETTRFSTYPTNQVNWAIVSSATRTAAAAIGPLTPVIIGSGGSTASVLSSNTNISLTAGQKVFASEVYKAGTSGRNRLRVSNAAALTSTLSGTVGDMTVADSGAGPWSDIVNQDLGEWSKVDAAIVVGTTESGYRLREGPDSAVAGQTSITAWSQLTSLPSDIILGTLTTPVTIPKHQATVDVSAYDVTGVVMKVTPDRIVTNAVLFEGADAIGDSVVDIRVSTGGVLSAHLAIAGVEVATIEYGTINARQEYTIGLEWRGNVLSGYVGGSGRVVDAFAGSMPAVTDIELFRQGGSNVVFAVVDLYEDAL